VRAVCIKVGDATAAYEEGIKGGAIGHTAPYTVVDRKSGKSMVISEIKQFGDVIIRWISGDYDGAVLPNYEDVPVVTSNSYGIHRIDHIVSNVPKLFEAYDYMEAATGFHQFGEFTAEDVGTVDSGLNSMVMANNNEFVLMPINEPTFDTPRKSQIQNFLEHNNGAGIQHIAVKTEDIFTTMREMKRHTETGGMDFMPRPSTDYYRNLQARIGTDALTATQFAQLEELGLLADRDDMGILLQIFTKPVGDRPTLFFEIIQRIGCDKDKVTGETIDQAGGCGGFGKGNFGELFKSIENFEKECEVVVAADSASAQCK
jgi:4-hydroxyphenylpyruvate dioxygenase